MPTDNDTAPVYRCAGKHCPGLPYRASDRGHPASCNEPPNERAGHLATLRAERARIAAVLDALRFTPRAVNSNVRGHLADALAPLYAAIEAADAQILAAEESAAINPT